MRLRLLTFLFLLIPQYLFALDFEVVIDPPKPVAKENFQVHFKIGYTGDKEPYISFNPGSAEVLSRQITSEVSSATIINGKLTSKKEITITYEMVADSSGPLRLSDIKVESDGDTKRAADVRTTILSVAETPKDIFLLAVPSKNKAYIGEGIELNYYLYYRVPILALEVKQFPKLNKFIKRFRTPVDREEAVEYNGILYRRSLKYQARVYPESVGMATIDPLTLSVQYASGSSSPFGGFGFQFGQQRRRDVSSPPVKIEIVAIPTENLPANFVGLVGDHDFSFKIQNNKYLVNEMIEMRLEITGPGALEKMEPPTLYQHQGLEEFETKGELIDQGGVRITKKFEYTYLGREGLNIPSRKLTFSLLDPDTGRFIEKNIDLPALIVEGQASRSQGAGPIAKDNERDKAKLPRTRTELPALPRHELLAPIFGIEKSEHSFSDLSRSLPIALAALLLLTLSFGIFRNFYSLRSNNKDLEKILKKLSKGKASYANVYSVLIRLDSAGASAREIIDQSSLDEEDKKRLIILLEQVAREEFGKTGSASEIQVESTLLNRLKNAVNDANNQNAK
jgi:hypothetical protein